MGYIHIWNVEMFVVGIADDGIFNLMYKWDMCIYIYIHSILYTKDICTYIYVRKYVRKYVRMYIIILGIWNMFI